MINSLNSSGNVNALTISLIIGFSPLKFGDCALVRPDVVDTMEALIAFCLLAKMSYADKINLVFKMCDTDNDDCLSLHEISNMCCLIDRVFAREASLVTFDSNVLLQSLAEKKAAMKFKRFMLGYYFDMQQAPAEDALVSFEEFMRILKSNASLYETFLPPTVGLRNVLVLILIYLLSQNNLIIGRCQERTGVQHKREQCGQFRVLQV